MTTVNAFYVMVDLPDRATTAQAETVVAQAIARYLIEVLKQPGNVTATLVKTLSNTSVANYSAFSAQTVDVSSLGTTTFVGAAESEFPTNPFVSSTV